MHQKMNGVIVLTDGYSNNCLPFHYKVKMKVIINQENWVEQVMCLSIVSGAKSNECNSIVMNVIV